MAYSKTWLAITLILTLVCIWQMGKAGSDHYQLRKASVKVWGDRSELHAKFAELYLDVCERGQTVDGLVNTYKTKADCSRWLTSTDRGLGIPNQDLEMFPKVIDEANASVSIGYPLKIVIRDSHFD